MRWSSDSKCMRQPAVAQPVILHAPLCAPRGHVLFGFSISLRSPHLLNVNLAADKPRHVAAITLAVIIHAARRGICELLPFLKRGRSEGCMSCAAVAHVATLEFLPPGGSGNRSECLTEKRVGTRGLDDPRRGSGVEDLGIANVDGVLVVAVAGVRPGAVPHDLCVHLVLCTPKGAARLHIMLFLGVFRCCAYSCLLVLLILLLSLHHVDEFLEVLGEDRAVLACAIDVNDVV